MMASKSLSLVVVFDVSGDKYRRSSSRLNRACSSNYEDNREMMICH